MIPISICVIMKNEESHLPNFIQAVKSAFNNYPYELLFVDTGSSDNSIFIAKASGASVLHFDWVNDFSAARNYGIERAKYDLILVLDCDEYLSYIDISIIESFYYNHRNSIGMIIQENSMSDSVDLYSSEIPRLFNRTRFRYSFPIHEQPRPIFNERYDYVSLPIKVSHDGYALSKEALYEKAKRNINLLVNEIKVNKDPYVLYQIGQSYYVIHDSEKACEYFRMACEYDLDPNIQYVQMMIISYGYALLDINHCEEALAFENIYDEFATTADFIVLMGIIYLRTGNVLQAMEQFAKATTEKRCFNIGANTYIPFYNMGCINEILGNTQDAIDFYRKCGNYKPALDRIEAIEG